ncbi:MAG: hypothetical protein P8Y63_11240 [Deltaproteobacteria bacterium]|jgi:hypothetical protein
MILRVTQKLAKKIKVAPKVTLPRDSNPFADWAAHLFTADRTQYILLTNSASLYSVIFYGRGISESDIFIDRVLSALRDFMVDAGHGPVFERCIVPAASEILLCKTGDRSLLGSMNDHIHCAKAHLLCESPFEAGHKLNSTPMGAIGYRFPNDMLVEQAGMSELAKNTGAKIIPFRRK